jgi:benzoyl-CoA reductase/2-hydroxyglutaryl-CoA dehydratase subunit BcrC/BadD/HgdB
VPSAQKLVFIYSRYFDISAVTVEVEHSTDLVNWIVAANGVNGVVITTQPVDDTMDAVSCAS